MLAIYMRKFQIEITAVNVADYTCTALRTRPALPKTRR